MRYIIPSLIFLVAVSGCGGTSSVEQYVVQSNPGVTPGFSADNTYFTNNVYNDQDNSVRPHPCFDIDGFNGDWGTRYVVTVRETPTSADIADACGVQRVIVSVDGETQDPIGTQYTNNYGSTNGGLLISRDAADPARFRLHGYNRPIFCEEPLCGPIADSVSAGKLGG